MGCGFEDKDKFFSENNNVNVCVSKEIVIFAKNSLITLLSERRQNMQNLWIQKCMSIKA